MMKKLKMKFVPNFPLRKIKIINPIRSDVRKITALWHTIKEYGMQNPLVIDPNNNLLIGKRRLTALRKGGVRREKVFICENPEDLLAMQLIENLQREDLNAIDKAKAFKRFMKSYNPTLSMAKAGKLLGVSHGVIERHIKLLTLPADIQRKIAKGHIRPFYRKQSIYKFAKKKSLSIKDFEELYYRRLLTRLVSTRTMAIKKLNHIEFLIKLKAEVVKTLDALNEKIDKLEKKIKK